MQRHGYTKICKVRNLLRNLSCCGRIFGRKGMNRGKLNSFIRNERIRREIVHKKTNGCCGEVRENDGSD